MIDDDWDAQHAYEEGMDDWYDHLRMSMLRNCSAGGSGQSGRHHRMHGSRSRTRRLV